MRIGFPYMLDCLGTAHRSQTDIVIRRRILGRAILPCMQLEYESEGPNRSRTTRKRGPWVEVTLITGFIISLLIGMGALAALWVSTRGDETSLTIPASQTIHPDAIVPQLALAELAGDPAEALAYQAIAAGELDTASVIALTATSLTDPQRLSLLLRLGERLLDADRPGEAAYHLNLARAVAVLNPSVEALERPAALTQVADGLYAATEEAAAQDASVQAMRAGQQTPGLLPTHRSQIYENLRPIAARLNDTALSQELGELIRNPYFEPPGVLITPSLPALRTNVMFDEELTAAILARQQAARVLADRILLTQGVDIEPETEALAAALVREDQLRDAYYRGALGQGLSLQGQYALLTDRRAWQAWKVRIALQGFGLSLVPQWEQDLDTQRQELGAATANVNLVAEALANELADPVAQAMLRAESLFWMAQQAELDLYPGSSLEELNGRLLAAQQELVRLGSGLALPVAYDREAAPAGFRIQSTR